MAKRDPQKKLGVGSRVYFHVGLGRLHGIVIEDRGKFGRPPRQIYRIRALEAPGVSDETYTFELPAATLRLMPEPRVKRKRPVGS